ncbi:ABC transporter ATP-binding protein [Leucobacter aridicollis]|uniref:ABC transporter ATP-binding protein n=1 Tax=Leucobacter aridicollis TaxID=283878 RepID=UPI002107AAAC|nr:ABC transporter ATP-binding protein [Leucobacter aridicollis]UTX54318.1 ABC transporter ATP-binding protein [Leucobacter aridicollis]
MHPNEPQAALSATGLSKRFGDFQAVSGVTFKVRRGRAFGLLGPNGSGKTTIVRLLNGVLAPTAGSVELFGEPLTQASGDRLRERVGVQTDTNLYETLSVHENLKIWGELYGVPKAKLPGRITELLEVLGLADRANSLAGTLSKGMRQKVAVGRAIIHEPELLFLDEPTAGLDPEASLELIDYLKQMIASLKTTLVICTHQLHGLEELCEDAGFLMHGEMVAQGAIGDLIDDRWPGKRVTVQLGDSGITGAAAAALVSDAVRAGTAIPEPDGSLALTVADDHAVEAAVATLAAGGAAIRAVVPETPTLGDLYFDVIKTHREDAR